MKVIFVSSDGRSRIEATAQPGERLMEVAQAHDLPIEGACEGAMACSTCHVIVDDAWYDRLPAPTENEEDMLDFAYGVCATSRLSCQIRLTEALNGLTVRLPPGSRNMLRG
jgi:ferredoxin